MLAWVAVLGRYFCKNTEVSSRIFLPTHLFIRVYTYTFIDFQRLFPPTRLFGLHVYSVPWSTCPNSYVRNIQWHNSIVQTVRNHQWHSLMNQKKSVVEEDDWDSRSWRLKRLPPAQWKKRCFDEKLAFFYYNIVIW